MNYQHSMSEIKEDEIKSRLEGIINLQADKKNSTETLKDIIGLIDLTTLNGNDTREKVTALCRKGVDVQDNNLNIPHVAAICVYPNFANIVSEELQKSGVKTAVVATGFPSGQTFREVKLLEVQKAVASGAEEIDMVISRGLFLESEYDEVFDEIKVVKEACGRAHLKVILETGELENLTQIYTAAKIAIDAGADFIKTSTGKIKPAAEEKSFLVMTDAIKNHFKETGKKVGIKPAGGISDTNTALKFYAIVKENLGESWLNNQLFRIGASSLLDKILNDLQS